MSNLARFGAAIAAALLTASAGVACSSSHTSAGPGGEACAALQLCCQALSGPQATACHDSLTGASDSACATALSSLVQAGGCTAAGLDAGAIPGVDGSGIPCSITGTCPGGGDASSVVDAGIGLPPGPECQTVGTCSDGDSFEACVETASSGACNAAVVFSDGTVYPCASCSDCAAASASAQAHCGTMPTPTVDAGPDCGSTPALHPETEAGVYCPFTSAGAIHCAVGQECCETPSTVTNGSTCQAAGAVCPITGSLAWACNGPLDCAGSAGGSVCCAGGSVTLDLACGFDRGAGFTGSSCAQACAAGEVTICSSSTDPCPSGTQCMPFKVAGVVLGMCQ